MDYFHDVVPQMEHWCLGNIYFNKDRGISEDSPVHGVEWMRLIMVSALVVSHVDWDGGVERGEEVGETWEGKRDNVIHQEHS